MKRITTLLAAMFVIVLTTNAWAYTLEHNKHVFVHMENTPAQYQNEDKNYFGGSDADAYYIKADGLS